MRRTTLALAILLCATTAQAFCEGALKNPPYTDGRVDAEQCSQKFQAQATAGTRRPLKCLIKADMRGWSMDRLSKCLCRTIDHAYWKHGIGAGFCPDPVALVDSYHAITLGFFADYLEIRDEDASRRCKRRLAGAIFGTWKRRVSGGRLAAQRVENRVCDLGEWLWIADRIELAAQRIEALQP